MADGNGLGDMGFFVGYLSAWPLASLAAPVVALGYALGDVMHPIQTGVSPRTIEPNCVAVLRGRVVTRAGEHLPGVYRRPGPLN